MRRYAEQAADADIGQFLDAKAGGNQKTDRQHAAQNALDRQRVQHAWMGAEQIIGDPDIAAAPPQAKGSHWSAVRSGGTAPQAHAACLRSGGARPRSISSKIFPNQPARSF